MASGNNDYGIIAFGRYHWRNFTEVIATKQRVLPRILFILALLVWIFRGLHSGFPDLPLGWTEKPWAKYVETAAAAVLLIFFFLWVPFRREGDLKQEHRTEKSGLLTELANLRERLKPLFSLSCGMEVSGCREVSRESNLTYFRLRVENTAEQQGIDGCTGTLVGVTKDGRAIPFGGSRALPFAPSHGSDSGAKTLLPKVPHFVDVVAIHAGAYAYSVVLPEVGGRVAPVVDSSGMNIFDQVGQYVLNVQISGHGVPTCEAKLLFNWTGTSAASTIAAI